ncbi:hypothetical protein ABPG74_013595 [Tetrahymena malaccensis]
MKVLIAFSLLILQATLASQGQYGYSCDTSGQQCSSACSNQILPSGCSWTGQSSQNCYVKDCSCAGTNQKVTDQYCQSCQGSSYFASIDRTLCVKASSSCIRNTDWTYADCTACTVNISNVMYTTNTKTCTYTQYSFSLIISIQSLFLLALMFSF